MKSSNLLLLALTIFMTTIFFGCRKKGCTDSFSITYDSDAKKDDGTCKYEGSVVFWFWQNTAIKLVMDGVTELTYCLDGQVMGPYPLDIYWYDAPECGQDRSITFTKSLGNLKTQSYTYSVKDQTGFIHWSGVINVYSNSCVDKELVR